MDDHNEILESCQVDACTKWCYMIDWVDDWILRRIMIKIIVRKIFIIFFHLFFYSFFFPIYLHKADNIWQRFLWFRWQKGNIRMHFIPLRLIKLTDIICDASVQVCSPFDHLLCPFHFFRLKKDQSSDGDFLFNSRNEFL